MTLDLKKIDTDRWRGTWGTDPRPINVTYEGERCIGKLGAKGSEYYPDYYVARFDDGTLIATGDTMQEVGINTEKNLLNGRTLTGY